MLILSRVSRDHLRSILLIIISAVSRGLLYCLFVILLLSRLLLRRLLVQVLLMIVGVIVLRSRRSLLITSRWDDRRNGLLSVRPLTANTLR